MTHGIGIKIRTQEIEFYEGNIDIQITKSSLKSLNVDKNGLDEMDNKILSTIIDKYNGLQC